MAENRKGPPRWKDGPTVEHYHIWLYVRDDDGVIRRMERQEAVYESRRKANYDLDKLPGNWYMAGRWRAAGQVVQCLDYAFCEPPPDWKVKVVTLGGLKEVGPESFIEQTPSIRPARKHVLGMESLAEYAEKDPGAVVSKPGEQKEV